MNKPASAPLPRDPEFEDRVRRSFAAQRVMTLFGASLDSVTPGEVSIVWNHQAVLTQQHGFLHAGVVATICDSACGYAALSLMAPQRAVLTVEYKINLLAPAAGRSFVAIGQVVKAGRTLSVCQGDVFADPDGARTHVASMHATMMSLEDRGLVD